MQNLIPFATQSKSRMKTGGAYAGGRGPKSLTVHYTAGRGTAQDVINQGIANGYTYHAIGKQGDLVQAHDASRYGAHCGKSAWPGYWGGLNDDSVGVEVVCAGLLTRQKDGSFKTWFGSYVDPINVRYVDGKAWGCPTGFYEKFTRDQEDMLTRTILWYFDQNPDYFGWHKKLGRGGEMALGHHEISGVPGIGYWRKSDPGGSLSMPMNEYREKLKAMR